MPQPSKVLGDYGSGNACSHLGGVGRRQGLDPTSNSAIAEWVCSYCLHALVSFIVGF